MKTITTKELRQKLESNQVHVIEVLEEKSFEKSHIQGAVNIPLERIGTEAVERFDKADELIVYCTDYDCTASPTAAKKLEDMGFKNVYDYEAGKQEWKEAGLPME